MVSAVDEGVGRLLDKLETLEIAENTIIFFLSDNGGPEPKNGSNNGPLREENPPFMRVEIVFHLPCNGLEKFHQWSMNIRFLVWTYSQQ